MKINLSSATDFVKFILTHYLNMNDKVIDATVGNEKDTEFLARRVGKNGKVYGFDLQKKSIETTIVKLKKLGIDKQVLLYNDSHENVDLYINEKINGVTFNLGYLPNDHGSIKTNSGSSLIALGKCLNLLKKNGIITIVSYLRHEGGREEYNTIESYLTKLNEMEFKIMKYQFLNSKNDAPVVFIIIKRSENYKS